MDFECTVLTYLGLDLKISPMGADDAGGSRQAEAWTALPFDAGKKGSNLVDWKEVVIPLPVSRNVITA